MHIYTLMCAAVWLSNSVDEWDVTAEWTVLPPLPLSAVSPHCALWVTGVAMETYIYSLLFSHPKPSLSLTSGSGTEYPSSDMHRVNWAVSVWWLGLKVSQCSFTVNLHWLYIQRLPLGHGLYLATVQSCLHGNSFSIVSQKRVWLS